MNPFDWRGPDFLLFYLALGAGLLFLARHLIRRREAHAEIPRLNLTDPYEIAMLRGGENEAMRVAAVSLVDRGLLKAAGDKLTAVEGSGKHVRRPIERAMLAHFTTPKVAHEMYSSPRLKDNCDQYRKDLQERKLVLGPEILSYRLPILLVAIAAALAVSWTKLAIAVERGRPVGFLVILTLILAVLLIRMLIKRRTVLGDRVMDDLRTLFQGLKGRAHLLRAGGDTNELALLVAVFGISALSSGHDYAKLLFPKASREGGSGCGGVSCSTGCGSGGGGGGCGGCGGGGD